MGFITEFNWALKLAEVGEVEPRKVYNFRKKDMRVYPINIPIDLINHKWEPIAKVIIKETTVKDNETSGKYLVVKVYEGIEKQVLTKYWQETVSIIKGD